MIILKKNENYWNLIADQSVLRKRYHNNAVMYEGIGSIPNAFYKRERVWIDKKSINLDYHEPTTEFEKIIHKRRTRRSISIKNISFSFLSKMLQFSAGISDSVNNFLSYPSPGATYPTTLFLYWKDSSYECMYRYNPFNHTLELYEQNNIHLVSKIIGDKVLKDFPLYIFFASDYQLIEEKYGAISYRLLNQEIGHIAQNITLYCEQEEYNSICIGGFFQSYFQQIVGKEYDLHYVMVVG